MDPETLEFKTQLRAWSMVAIRDSHCSVFPPINHENLQLPTSPSLSSSSSSSLSSFSPSDSDESDPVSPKEAVPELTSWVGFGVALLRAKLLGIGSLIRSFSSGAGILAVVFMLWSFYVRVRQRRFRKRCDLIIKEKDEKINKLLHQIAQMNEVLVARHRVLASKMPN